MTSIKVLALSLFIVGQGYGAGLADQDSVHAAAHFGLGFAATTVLYGFCHKGLRMEPMDARIFSAFAVLSFSLLRQATVGIEYNQPTNMNGFYQSAVGVGAAAGATWMFEF